jgi:hypothetical protein
MISNLQLLLLVSSLTLLFAKHSFVFFNACPSSALQFQFGSDPSSLTDDGATGIYAGVTIVRSVSYSPVYYHILDGDNNLLVSSMLTITNDNMNGIGYVSYPNGGCQHFQYAPTDPTLSSRSVVVYVNGANQDKNAYIGAVEQGLVPAQPNTFLEITDISQIEYSVTNVRFCNTSCVSSATGSATIPVGSAAFFVNYMSSNTSSSSYVTTAGTGSTSIDYWCSYCDLDLDFDDDYGISEAAIIGAVVGSVIGCCLLCGLGYLIYYCCSGKKKGSSNESASLRAGDTAVNKL